LYEYKDYKGLDNRRGLIYMLMALIVGINFIPVFVVNNVDYTGHLGGLITGLLFGLFYHLSKV
jgi:membrane associated rhomboid family serine protease